MASQLKQIERKRTTFEISSTEMVLRVIYSSLKK